MMSSEQIVWRLQAHADVKTNAVITGTNRGFRIAAAKVHGTIALSNANAWSLAEWARSMHVIDRYLPSAEAVTMTRHGFDGTCEGAEFLPQ